MATRRATSQLIVIVGPTASGKSDAAMQAARQWNGEIICADSRTVYKGLDVGTAKPSAKDQAEIRHHLLDIREANEGFSAAEFQLLANKAIADIYARGKLPILVGGTGLFVDGILFSYEFGPSVDTMQRAELEKLTVAELQDYCKNHNIELPQNAQNKRHLVRAIERGGINRKRQQAVRPETFVVGIAPEKELLKQRIRSRSRTIVSQAAINEARKIARKHGWNVPGLSGNIYPIIRRLQNKEITSEQAAELFVTADWQLARRQMTWFKRNPYINWVVSSSQAVDLILKHLAHLP